MTTIQIQHNIDLKPFNTFGIQAKAQYFTAVNSIEELCFLFQSPEWKGFPKFILGGGSNVLFTQDYPGLLIKNEIKGIQRLSDDGDTILIKIGAGENWHEFVLHCLNQGWGGVENLSLIAGTVGAAPVQNIGAYGVEFSEIFHELSAVSLADGSIKIFNNAECQFGYRDSIFKSTCKDQYVIADVTLKLHKKPKFNISYSGLQEILTQMNVRELSFKAISDAVISIRQSKLPDPKVIGNAGSFFKNPIISADDFIKIQNKHENIPFFPEKNSDSIKIPAAWLIEQCGWKGKRLGDVGVHDKQALVIVNYGSGTGAAISDMAKQIKISVYDRFGVQLIPEVNIV